MSETGTPKDGVSPDSTPVPSTEAPAAGMAPPAADSAPAPVAAAPAPAAPNRRTMLGVPVPAAPIVITAVLPAELLALIDPALRAQDLSRDRLLMPAPRVQVDKLVVPALGGIPVFVKLGQGGMGAVYYGIHPQSRSAVAVKVVPVAAASPQTLEDFQSETQIASKIISPHLVPVKDQGKHDGLFFVVTDYIPGVSAGKYLRQATEGGDTGLPEAVALDLCIAATKGLAEAHKNGIIHRDIRPENILIPRRKDGKLAFKEARLADLGLPRVEDLGGMLAASSATIGTPGYVAPEQAADAKASRKPSDVFSLGATLYALLTGRSPFASDNPMNAIMHTIQTPHEPVSKMRKDVSAVTCEVVDCCLAKHPHERYVDASALLQALTVCRNALDDPQNTQRSAVKRVTLVLRKAEEVGAKVLGSDSATPTAIPFLEELASAAKDAAQTPPQETDGKPRTSVLPDEAGDEETAVADAAPPVPAAAPAPGPPQAGAAPAPPEADVAAPGGKTIRAAAVAGAVVLVGVALALISRSSAPPLVAVGAGIGIGFIAAIGLALVWRAVPTSISLETVDAHAVLLKSAREMLKADVPAAGTLLRQARSLGIRDPVRQRREQAVADLIKAYELSQAGADDAAVERSLDAAAKVYPGDQAIELLRGKMRQAKEPG